MKKKLFFLQVFLLLSGVLSAQNVVKGKIINSKTNEKVSAVLVEIKDASTSTFTDDKGRFEIRTNKSILTLVVSANGFETKEVDVQDFATPIEIEMMPANNLGEVIVTSASRTTQRKLTSPVTIEQISLKEIKNSPQLNYLDMVQGLKGVDVTVSSIGFTSVTTRGFNTSGNTNFTQITDGMDNQAPGLNFPLGQAISLTQLDIENIEMLSGASSALYGSRGLNGTMVMTGKDPFKYQGFSFLVTGGVNHVNGKKNQDPVSASPYQDYTVRWAKKINDKLAFKINSQFTKAKDWVATDASNKNGIGNQDTDPNYNGVNYYGSATSVDINPFLQGARDMMPELAPIIDPLLQNANYVARTGYQEYGYLDNNAKFFKINGEVRYKITDKIQAVASGTYGTGNAVYTNDTRYQLKGFKIGQYRVELKSDAWFVRSYATTENSGHTLIAGPTAQYINEGWKPSYDPNTGDGWYPQYTMALLNGLATGLNISEAHIGARNFADQGRAMPGTPEFNQLKNQISLTPITQGGTLFLDRSKMYNTEAQYNFSKIIPFVDVIGGLNWRMYNLNSDNTLFPDDGKPINVNEYSGYLQLGKKVLSNALTLQASFRYDKNSLFGSPKITSRASAVFEPAHENYIRFSYQNAYSFPSNIQALQNTLIGYNSYASGGSSFLLNEKYEFNKYAPYTIESVEQFQQSKNSADLVKFEYNDIKPQSVNSFELGYAALIGKKVLLDVLGYFSTWDNFIGYEDVANTPGTTDVNAFLDRSTYFQYNIALNGDQTVNTYGFAASVSVDLSRNYMFKMNYYTDKLENKNENQVKNFNTPNYHINAEFSNSGLGKKQLWQFSSSLRYKPAYYYVVTGGLGKGTVPASAVIDAQVSYRLPKIHSAIKLGGTNITNKYYSTGIANPRIGAVYYVTYAYNVF